MADAATDPAGDAGEGGKKGGLKPLILGLVLALAGAGAGYFAATSGLLGGNDGAEAPKDDEEARPVFVEMPPIIVSIARPGGIAQLRMGLSLEVKEGAAGDVTELMPRLLDVLNSYLRAVETVDLADVSTLVRLRAQMLRRVQIVTGEGVVSDLLIQEFVVN